jgi:hypothetical protein
MFNQSEIVWRYLSGMDTSAARSSASGDVVRYWQARWQGELRPEERTWPRASPCSSGVPARG